MNCKTMHERMMDVLYGEDLDPDRCLEFFRHLDGCSACASEYRELVETRSLLGRWDPGRTVSEPRAGSGGKVLGFLRRAGESPAWKVVYRVAASVLILLGMTVIARDLGWAERTERAALEVTREELETMINDVAVSRQAEERRIIGQFLIRVRDDIEEERRRDMNRIQEYLRVLERQQVETREENNRTMRALFLR